MNHFLFEHGELTPSLVLAYARNILPAHTGLRSGEAFDEARYVCDRGRQITYGALSILLEVVAFVRRGSQLMYSIYIYIYKYMCKLR